MAKSKKIEAPKKGASKKAQKGESSGLVKQLEEAGFTSSVGPTGAVYSSGDKRVEIGHSKELKYIWWWRRESYLPCC